MLKKINMIHTSDYEFLISALAKEGSYITNKSFFEWMESRRRSVTVNIDIIPFRKLKSWGFVNNFEKLSHDSGKFFSIEGISVDTNYGYKFNWSQPIINQPEIGYLGIITKEINGVLHFLMQAKIEPGNINTVQLSPTLQATKSNYSRVHNGNTPNYLEFFNGDKKVEILLDQLQSEQGARFLRKRNRNIIVKVCEEIDVLEDYCWLTLGQIKSFLMHDNLVNMDTRTVIAAINYGTFSSDIRDLIVKLVESKTLENTINRSMLLSAISESGALNSIEEIISWVTNIKTRYELIISYTKLLDLKEWIITDSEIVHRENRYFSIIATDIHIQNREVVRWSQPLVKSAQEGLIALIVKRVNGIYHFLIQGKVEAGNFDIVEFAPTIQCLTGNYRTGENEYEVPFLNCVLNIKDDKILYKAFQSEEGGRFYHEQNLNLIVEVSEDSFIDPGDNFCWLTLNQLLLFIKFNNYLNIQLRSLISVISFN